MREIILQWLKGKSNYIDYSKDTATSFIVLFFEYDFIYKFTY